MEPDAPPPGDFSGHPSWLPVLEWLDSSAAGGQARQHLCSYGLRGFYEPDDLLSITRANLLRSLRCGPLPPGRNPVAYARRALRNAAKDLVSNARSHRLWDEVPMDGEQRELAPPTPQAGPETISLWNELLDCLLRWLESCGEDARYRSAATQYLSFVVDPGRTCPAGFPTETPRGREAMWYALWNAGLRRCIPTSPTGDSPTVRQSRSRAIARVDGLVYGAYDACTGGGSPTNEGDGS